MWLLLEATDSPRAQVNYTGPFSPGRASAVFIWMETHSGYGFPFLTTASVSTSWASPGAKARRPQSTASEGTQQGSCGTTVCSCPWCTLDPCALGPRGLFDQQEDVGLLLHNRGWKKSVRNPMTHWAPPGNPHRGCKRTQAATPTSEGLITKHLGPLGHM